VVEWVLAVDFGTSNTAAAGHELGRSHRARAVKLSSASTEMPSGVLAHDGRLLTGESAYNQAGACPPGGYERTPKRRLGEGQLLLGDRLVEDVELVAVVLRAAVDKVARQFSGVAPGQVRLTHPAAWAGLRLERLLVAASQAGLAEPMLVAEPVAAATWYVVEHGGRQPPGPVAVVDVGGGTTDVAVLQPDGDAGFSLRAVGGIDPLGGEVFDQALHDLVGELVAERGRSDLWERLHDGGAIGQRRTLDDQVRAAKHTLSEESVAYIQVAVSDDVETVTVTREQFNARIRPLFEPAVTATRQALADANLESTDLAAWYLTGGSSHVHLVHELLTTALSTPPTNFVDDPKTVTCLGALHHTTLVCRPGPQIKEEAEPDPPRFIDVALPELGELVDGGVIVEWLVEVGDEVEVAQPLVEISTDKVDTEIPSPVAGTITEIKADVDDEVEVGAVLVRITTPQPVGGGIEPARPHQSQVVDAPLPRGDWSRDSGSTSDDLTALYAATVTDIRAAIPNLSRHELVNLVGHERAHRNRVTVIRALETRLQAIEEATADALEIEPKPPVPPSPDRPSTGRRKPTGKNVPGNNIGDAAAGAVGLDRHSQHSSAQYPIVPVVAGIAEIAHFFSGDAPLVGDEHTLFSFFVDFFLWSVILVVLLIVAAGAWRLITGKRAPWW
jgi:hypothetical protein